MKKLIAPLLLCVLLLCACTQGAEPPVQTKDVENSRTLVSTDTFTVEAVVDGENVKYRYTDMRGPGYFLPDVPFTMYFYQGYGIHGTYWHNNFGTPMSHGCINMRTSEAEWVYNFSEVGTTVVVHY